MADNQLQQIVQGHESSTTSLLVNVQKYPESNILRFVRF